VMTDYANVRWQDVRQSVRKIRKTGPLSLPSWPGGHLALDVRELRTAARGQVGCMSTTAATASSRTFGCSTVPESPPPDRVGNRAVAKGLPIPTCGVAAPPTVLCDHAPLSRRLRATHRDHVGPASGRHA